MPGLLKSHFRNDPDNTVRLAQLADLDVVLNQYVLQSCAFSPKGRRLAIALVRRAKARAGKHFPAQFMVLMAQITALAENAHDCFDSGTGWWPSTRLPIKIEWFPDGLVVTRAGPQWLNLLGARITRIDGRPLDQVLRRLRRYFGGPDNHTRWAANWALETGGILHAMGIARRADRVEYAMVLPTGQEIRQVVDYVEAQACPPPQTRAQQLGATPTDQEDHLGWRSAVRGWRDPFYLQEPQSLFRLARLAELDALYLQFRAHYGTDSQPIGPFITRVEAEIRANPPRNMVVDLRGDSGGNTDLTVAIVSLIAQVVPGMVYVLIGPYTFSAGIVTAALLKRAAGNRAVLVGEEVGDRLRWWSEGRTVPLPHSGYVLHLSDGLWDLQKGCAGEDRCYGDRFDAIVGSLSPDLPAAITASSWLDGEDPGMEAIRRDLAGRGRAGVR